MQWKFCEQEYESQNFKEQVQLKNILSLNIFGGEMNMFKKISLDFQFINICRFWNDDSFFH
jgi:hypothetical protein